MKLRVPVAILLAASLGIGVAACGGDSDEEKAEKAIAEAIEKANDDLENASDDLDQAEDKAEDKADDANDEVDDSDTSMPDLENLGDCMEISFAYAGLALASLGGAMGGEDISDADMAELKKSIEELRKDLPKEIQEDFGVVAEAYDQLFEKGFTNKDAQKALESDKFTEASENVQEYIDDLCA